MTFYMESIKAVEAVAVQKGRKKKLAIGWGIFSIVMVSVFPVLAAVTQTSEDGMMAAAAGTVLTAGLLLLGWLMIGGLINRQIRQYESTITLSEQEVILTDGLGKTVRRLGYDEINRAEVMFLRADTSAREAASSYRTYQMMPCICLHLSDVKIPDGEYKSQFCGRRSKVIAFPYCDEAWRLVNEYMSAGRVKAWNGE